MVAKTKKQKKGFISEENISTVLQRYTATTVLALLQEVAQYPGVKLDWNALVKKTSTGISNAREYQMLWRHLAYRDSLLELEDGTEPRDDDSDLEYELEALPHVSGEASAEAAACVKVLIASGLPSDSSLPKSSTVEAPLTINIPSGPLYRASSENSQPAWSTRGMNITIPVSVQKQSWPSVTSTEGVDTNGSASGSMAARRKRKLWSEAEDLMLIANVEKHGEGNWATIVKGDFKGDRTASQLSQRWAILKKKRGKLNVGTSLSQRTEMQLATNHALSVALPVKRPPAINLTAVGTSSNSTSGNSVLPSSITEALVVRSSFLQAQHQFQHGSIPTKSSPVGSLSSVAKSRVSSKKTFLKSNLSSDSMVTAAKVTDGARISSPSGAPSLLNAAQEKNSICGPSSGSSIKSSMPSGTPTNMKALSTVCCNCIGLAAVPLSRKLAVNSAGLHSGSVEAASQTVQHADQTNAVNAMICRPTTELSLKPEVKHAEEMKVSKSDNAPKEQAEEDGAFFLEKERSGEVQEDKAALRNLETKLGKQANVSENPNSSLNMEVVKNARVDVNNSHVEKSQNENDSKMMGSPVNGIEKQSEAKEKCENENVDNKADLSTMVTDECTENLEVLSKAEAGNGM